ncbi:VanZ family protein [Kitasatospora viridis]|uniref:VanZ like protein n=1 Tax=Kitasatospora viridis TaxID=281105 RepID=A0A561UJR9_9ACTN|nr:VanZ family protein [Kitasatospora viridis]TWF99610.1 VanZ like protein [Kitasatospora viridis]
MVLLTLHFAVLSWLTLRAVPATAWAYDANLTPFATLHRAFAAGGGTAARQVLAALAQTAPFGVLLPLVGGRLYTRWLPSFLHAVGLSALIATGLEVLETSAGRVLNVDDVLIGVVGAALVHLLLVPATRAALRARAAGGTSAGGVDVPNPPVLRADPEADPQIRVTQPGETRGSRIGIRADA